MRNHLNNKKGSILLTAYMLIASLLIFGTSFLSSALSEIRACNAFIDNAQAFEAAELALRDVAWRHDNWLPISAGPIHIQENIYGILESVDTRYGSFTAKAVGFVSSAPGILNPEATFEEVAGYMRTKKMVITRGIPNTFLHTMSVGGHGSEFGNLVIQGPQPNDENQGQPPEFFETNGEIDITGNLLLVGTYNKLDNNVEVTFENEDLPFQLVDERLINPPYFDTDEDGAWEASDLVSMMVLATSQLAESHPKTVEEIPIPESIFDMSTEGATIVYDVDIGSIPLEKRTILIYPVYPDLHEHDFKVNLGGNVSKGSDRTFIVSGKTSVNFEALGVNENGELVNRRAKIAILSWGDIELGSVDGDDSDKDNMGLLAISHNDIKFQANTNPVDESVWNVNLFAGKDVIITTAPGTQMAIKKNNEIYYQGVPNLFDMDVPSDLTPYLYVAPPLPPDGGPLIPLPEGGGGGGLPGLPRGDGDWGEIIIEGYGTGGDMDPGDQR